MDPASLHRYASAYAAQRSAADWVTHDSTIVLNAPRMASLQTQLDLGVAVDPVEFVSVLRQMVHTMTETQSHLQQTQAQIQNALPAGTDTDTGTAAH
jgi:hypothetical protein